MSNASVVPNIIATQHTNLKSQRNVPLKAAMTFLCGVVFPTPESSLHVSRHPCQHMGAINGTNVVLKTMEMDFIYGSQVPLGEWQC